VQIKIDNLAKIRKLDRNLDGLIKGKNKGEEKYVEGKKDLPYWRR
jgi:hypothetical protein